MRTGGLEAGTVATKPSNLLPPLKKFRLTVFTSKKQFTNNVPLSFEVCKFVTFLTFRHLTEIKYCQAFEAHNKGKCIFFFIFQQPEPNSALEKPEPTKKEGNSVGLGSS